MPSRAALLAEVNDAIIALDVDFRILHWNKAAERQLEWPAEEAVGKIYKDVLQTAISESERLRIHEEILEHGRWQGELPCRKRSGATIVLEISVACFRDENGDPNIVGIHRDVTMRRQTEAKLASSEQLFKLVESALAIGTWVKDLQSGKSFCSEQMLRLLGISGKLEGFDGKEFFEHVHPEDRDRVSAEFQQSLETRTKAERHFRVMLPDGSVRWIFSKSHVTLDAQGRPDRVVGMDYDETEQVCAREQLRLLSSAVEQSPVSIVITDLDGNIEYVNRKVTEITGYSSQELAGRNPRLLKSGETTPEEYRRLWETIRSKEWQGIFHNRKKNGDLYWESATIGPVRGESGMVTHYLAIKEDITERRAMAEDLQERLRVEAELLRAKEVAEAANRAKSTFLANMSHEIRTPMNAVLGYSQLMLRDPDLNADAKEHLLIINRSGEHLLALINDILEMSKIEAGKVTLNPSTFDLFRLIEDLDQMFRLRSSSKGIDLAVLKAPDCAASIETDKGKLCQVLINLLGNAVKFTEAGTVVLRVSTPRRGTGKLVLQVSVEDTGPGIDPAEQSRLFQPFSQGDTGRNIRGGTGLGLAISREFVRLMGGDMGVWSVPGKGSTFYFEIPVQQASPETLSQERAVRKRCWRYNIARKRCVFWLRMTSRIIVAG